MADNANVPVTVIGSFADFNYAAIAIGGGNYAPPDNNFPPNSYWFLVVDLSSLQYVVNEISTNITAVPAKVAQYTGNAQFLLIFTSISTSINNSPQGDLHSFLHSVGSGPMLDRLEQFNEQFSCGIIQNMSYVLAATMSTADDKGFEELSFNHQVVMTFQLMPVDVGGTTIYAPIMTGA